MQLRMKREVLWENSRYDSTYIFDRSSLSEHLRVYASVVHLGQILDVEAIVSAFPEVKWTIVAL